MGKLMTKLEQQLATEYKKDAEDCIEIYNWIKSTDKEGRVWSSRWSPLVSITFKGWRTQIYKPNIMGYTLLRGIRNKS